MALLLLFGRFCDHHTELSHEQGRPDMYTCMSFVTALFLLFSDSLIKGHISEKQLFLINNTFDIPINLRFYFVVHTTQLYKIVLGLLISIPGFLVQIYEQVR